MFNDSTSAEVNQWIIDGCGNVGTVTGAACACVWVRTTNFEFMQRDEREIQILKDERDRLMVQLNDFQREDQADERENLEMEDARYLEQKSDVPLVQIFSLFLICCLITL